jgi:hypothetical protein
MLFGGVALFVALPAYGDSFWNPLQENRANDQYVQPINGDQGFVLSNVSMTSYTPAPTPATGSQVTQATAMMGGDGDAAPSPSAGSASCGCCDTPCCSCCCSNPFEHRTGAFVEYMVLRAYNVDMAHGIQQNGVGGLGTAPAGDVGVAAPQFDSGFRVGFDWAVDACSGFTVTYAQFESHTTDFLAAPPGIGGTTNSLVLHPGTVTSASTFDSLDARYDIDFKYLDLDYSVLMGCNGCGAWNFIIGMRYAHLRQDFGQLGEFAGATGEEFTSSTINFDGFGLRAGLDGQYEIGQTRWAVYGKGALDIVFGQFNSHYNQFDVTTSTPEAFSNWTDNRVVPILDYEVGLRWVSCSGRCFASVGYYTAFWFNTIDTAEFVQAVQRNDFTEAHTCIAFTGWTARLEYRF